MTTPAIIIGIIYVLALTTCVVPLAVGLEPKGELEMDRATRYVVYRFAKGEKVVMTYDGSKQTFTMDRTKSGDVGFSEAFPCVTEAPTYGAIKQLRIFIDRCSIEAFDSQGKMAIVRVSRSK